MKKEKLIGKFIDLFPIEEKYFNDVISLRNEEKSKYFLNQTYDLTYNMQKAWYDEYLKRENDIYYVICKKDGTVVGTIRLYNIDILNKKCEEGSMIIGEKYSGTTPYCLEAKLLLFDYAFFRLGLNLIVNENKLDNDTMNNISYKMGFKLINKTNIRGVKYNYLILKKEDYNGEILHHILNMVN